MKKSGLTFIGYTITDFKFSMPSRENLRMKINHTNTIDKNDNLFSYTLQTIVFEGNKKVVDVSIKGDFEIDSDAPTDHRKIYMNTSAPTILYPYLRSFVSSTTAQCGRSPLNLPIINLSPKRKKK